MNMRLIFFLISLFLFTSYSGISKSNLTFKLVNNIVGAKSIKIGEAIDGFSNDLLLNSFNINNDSINISFCNTEALGISFELPKARISGSLYLKADENVIVIIDLIRKEITFPQDIEARDKFLFTKKRLVKEYVDFFAMKDDDVAEGLQQLDSIFNSLDGQFVDASEEIGIHYKADIFITLFKSFFRKYKDYTDINFEMYLRKYISNETIKFNLKNYSYYYLIASFKKDYESEIYKDCSFIDCYSFFDTLPNEEREFMWFMQFYNNIKIKLFQDFEVICEIYENLKVTISGESFEDWEPIFLAYLEGKCK